VADNPLKYDPVKAATASSLIKQGFTEDQAFDKAGITEAEYGTYSIDDVPGSVTRGQVIKGLAATNYTEEQAAQNKATNYAERQSWVDKEVEAETAGPVETRTTSSVVTTGGAERVTKMTPEMSDWTDKKSAAYKQDQAATDAAREDFYRSKGLEGATRGEKLKALTAARNSGEFTDVTTAQEAVGAPPKTQYTTEVIQPNLSGEQTPNDGSQTEDQAAKNSAAGQSAEDKVKNDSPPGTTAEKISDEEAAKAGGENNTAADTSSESTTPTPSPGKENELAAGNNTSSTVAAQQGSITGTTSNVTPTEEKDANTKQAELSTVIASLYKNKLHEYTGYTYRVTLFLLTKEDYLSMTDSPTTFEPKHSLISGGGGYATDSKVTTTRTETGFGGYLDDTKTTKGRHPDFQEDFFIENLSIQTVVGLNAKTKASNAIDISFSIIEPYGMTLLDRLLSACEITAKCSNYIDQPYLLEIDFLSNIEEQNRTDDSRPKGILIDRKRLAIKFIEMKIKPGAGGTEYRVKATPYNHSAFAQSAAALPINLSVEASTVGDFFNSDSEADKIFGKGLAVNAERVESELQKWIEASTVIFANIKPTPAQIQEKKNELEASLGYTTNSLPAAYNEYMRSISTKGKLFTYPQTLISFKIDPLFVNSPIVDPDKTEVSSQPMIKSLEGISVTIPGYQNPNFKTKQIYNIHAGTDIVAIIDRIMQSSKYIKDQVLNATKLQQEQAAKESSNGARGTSSGPGDEYKYLDWYKIVPQIRLLNFDESRNAYSKQIIYNIVPFKTANSYHPDFKTTKVSKNKIARSYQYWYTGKNEDIISVDIDFDTSFYTQLTTFQENKRRSGSNYLSNSPFLNPVQARDGADNNRTQDIPVQYNAIGSEQQGSNSFNRGKDPNDQAVSSLVKSIYTSSRGDMLNIKLKIVGDPGFIKQDDVYYNPSSSDYKQFIKGSTSGGEIVPINQATGQILFDQEQIYVQFITKNAVDIDDNTGITNKQIKLSNGKTTNSSFSGVYKVLTVRSEIAKGKFEQTLDLVKMPNDIMFDDQAKTSESVSVTKPSNTVQAKQNVDTQTPPPPPVAQSPAVAPSAELKAAGNSPAVNPTINNPGAGSEPTSNQPSAAAPANINDTQVVSQQNNGESIAVVEYKESIIKEYNNIVELLKVVDTVEEYNRYVVWANKKWIQLISKSTDIAYKVADPVVTGSTGEAQALKTSIDEFIQPYRDKLNALNDAKRKILK
jgi:hypothetical protein